MPPLNLIFKRYVLYLACVCSSGVGFDNTTLNHSKLSFIFFQETNSSFETRLSEYETDRVKQVHQQSVLESQLKSVEEVIQECLHYLYS